MQQITNNLENDSIYSAPYQVGVNTLEQIHLKLKNSFTETKKLNEQIASLVYTERQLNEVEYEVSRSIDLLKGLIDDHSMRKPSAFTQIKNLFLKFDANTFNRWSKEMGGYLDDLNKKYDKRDAVEKRLADIINQKTRIEAAKKELSQDSKTFEMYEDKKKWCNDDIINLLYSCAETDNVRIVEWLFSDPIIKNGVNINHQSESVLGERDSFLMTAMFYKSPKVAEFLLSQKGIDVNAKDWQDMTAFDIAVWVGFTDGIKLIYDYYDKDLEIIERWFGLNLSNSIEVAKSRGHTETLKLLQQTDDAIMEKHELENTPSINEDGDYVWD